MIVILDKITKQVINNLGINPLFPNGNIPNLKPNENEIFIRIDDNSELVKKILNAECKSYTFVFDNDDNVVDVLINKTIEEYQKEKSQLNTLIPSVEEIEKAERQINLINDLTELGVI